MAIDLSQSREEISDQLTAALVARIEKEDAPKVIKHMLDMVLGHSFVDDELEVELQETLADVAGVEFINSPNEDEDDDDE